MADRAEMGDLVKDRVTGFTGIVMGRTQWIYGCDRIWVQPQELKDGKKVEMDSFDEAAIEIVTKSVINVASAKAPIAKPGGPVHEPARKTEHAR